MCAWNVLLLTFIQRNVQYFENINFSTQLQTWHVLDAKIRHFERLHLIKYCRDWNAKANLQPTNLSQWNVTKVNEKVQHSVPHNYGQLVTSLLYQ